MNRTDLDLFLDESLAPFPWGGWSLCSQAVELVARAYGLRPAVVRAALRRALARHQGLR